MRPIPLAGPLVAALLSGPAAAADDEAPCGLHTYRAVVTRVIDGDTVVADIDLGFHTWRRGEHLRLLGIDAPEPEAATRAAGLAATQALRRLVEGRAVILRTRRDRRDGFGRYLAEIRVDGTSVAAWMLARGHARPFDR